MAVAGCGKHCGHGCDAERKPSLRDRLKNRNDSSDLPPPGARTPQDPSVFQDPAAPPGVIPPRSYGIPPTSIPTTPGTFDPGAPLQPPIRNQFRPEPVPHKVPSEPLPPHKSNKELLLPEDSSPPPLKPATEPLMLPPVTAKTESKYPDRSILLEPIVAWSPSDVPGKTAPPPAETPVPMKMRTSELPDAIPDKPRN